MAHPHFSIICSLLLKDLSFIFIRSATTSKIIYIIGCCCNMKYTCIITQHNHVVNVTKSFKINDVSETDVSKNQRNEKL